VKTHFLALFNIGNRKKTLTYLLLSIVLIIASLIVGISDNPPGIVLIGVGTICFYYSFVHIWKKSRNFVLLIYVSIGIALLQILIINIFGWMHKTQYLSEGLIMGVFFLICIPLLLVGVLGAFSRPIYVAGKWGIISGIILLAIGIIISPFLYLHNYKMNHSVGWSMFSVLIVGFPFVLAGLYFIWNHYKRIKHPEK
jgi:hypothetical protein